MYSKEPSLGELTSATKTPIAAVHSRIASHIRSSDSPACDNGSPLLSAIDTLDGEMIHRLASVFCRAATEAVDPRMSIGKARSNHTSAFDGAHDPATGPQSTSGKHRTVKSFAEVRSSRSSESALSAVSDAIAQFREASIDSRASRHTRGLDDHKFTLIVPFDRALAILEIIEGIRAEFNLGDEGVKWEYNREQWEQRQRQLEEKSSRHKVTSLASSDETRDNGSKFESFRNKWGARIAKVQPWSLSYADVRIDRIVLHAMGTMWRQWGNNPYHLPPAFYFVLFMGLAAWAIGSIVCGYFEALARVTAGDLTGARPTFWRGVIGAIPALTGITTFLFPPTFCVRYR